MVARHRTGGRRPNVPLDVATTDEGWRTPSPSPAATLCHAAPLVLSHGSTTMSAIWPALAAAVIGALLTLAGVFAVELRKDRRRQLGAARIILS